MLGEGKKKNKKWWCQFWEEDTDDTETVVGCVWSGLKKKKKTPHIIEV